MLPRSVDLLMGLLLEQVLLEQVIGPEVMVDLERRWSRVRSGR